tara:strand:- start:1290 stop:1619 length:330 start_codon:yes stop_codon:yes gene_type:complete
MDTNQTSGPSRSLKVLYGMSAIVQIIVILEFLLSPNESDFLTDFFQFIDQRRSGLLLAQLFACGVLFVDAVLRFDSLKFRWAHCLGIAFFACNWMFQMFVHFLSSSYLT